MNEVAGGRMTTAIDENLKRFRWWFLWAAQGQHLSEQTNNQAWDFLETRFEEAEVYGLTQRDVLRGLLGPVFRKLNRQRCGFPRCPVETA
jgi:hypothetical protein